MTFNSSIQRDYYYSSLRFVSLSISPSSYFAIYSAWTDRLSSIQCLSGLRCVLVISLVSSRSYYLLRQLFKIIWNIFEKCYMLIITIDWLNLLNPGGKPVYPTWARNYHNRGCGNWPAVSTCALLVTCNNIMI